MSRDAPATAGAVLPAKQTTTTALPFVRDGDTAFPLAGAGLLLALLMLACWTWWRASRPNSRSATGMLSGVLFRTLPASVEGVAARVVGTTRLSPGGALYVVEWRGSQVLLAINGSSDPVVLGRYPPSESMTTDTRR